MRALTIWQPWAACIAYGPKRVENRGWRPPERWRLPFDLAIHAAKTRRVRDEAEARMRVADIWPLVNSVPMDRGAVVAVASVVGFFATLDEPRRTLTDPWVIGPWCWQLDRVRPLICPVPCKGQQGIWTLPPDVEAEIREVLR